MIVERVSEIDACVDVPLREREVDDPAGQRGLDAGPLGGVEALLECGEVVGDEHAHGELPTEIGQFGDGEVVLDEVAAFELRRCGSCPPRRLTRRAG